MLTARGRDPRRERPAAGGLELGNAVEVHDRVRSGPGLEPHVDGGCEAVRGGRLDRGVGLVRCDHGRAPVPQGLHELTGQGAQAAELADDDAQLGERAGVSRELLQLAHRGHAWPGPGLAGQDVERTDGVDAADPVDRQAAVVLEVRHRVCRARSEDPVDPAGVESEARQERLDLGDVVAAEVGCREQEQAVAEPPGGLDDRSPRVLIALAGDDQTAFALEGPQGGLGGRAKKRRLGAGGREPGGTEAALEVANGLAALTGSQWEVPRNSSSSCNRAPLPLAPTIFFLTSPSWINSSVGMLITL